MRYTNANLQFHRKGYIIIVLYFIDRDMIDNSLASLNKAFQFNVNIFLEVVKQKYPNIAPFETYRSRARQAWLYSNKKGKGPVAKPGTSMHERGLAVDRVFLDKKGQATWKGDYKFIQLIGNMCGMVGVPGESCHLQSDFRSNSKIMTDNSNRWKRADTNTRKWLSITNGIFRKKLGLS